MHTKTFEPKLVSLLKEGLTLKMFFRDALAGIIVGIVAFPLAIAFAIASGVKPEQGLITAVIAGFLISLFSGSRVHRRPHRGLYRNRLRYSPKVRLRRPGPGDYYGRDSTHYYGPCPIG